jgi:hypothetical protein
LVSLDSNPLIAVIAGQIDLWGHLESNESLVIVRGGVDQMTDDFLIRPLPRRRATRRDRFIHLVQPVGNFQGGKQIVSY